MKKAKTDDGLEWLRDIRRSMTARFENDPKKLEAHYMTTQRKYTTRLYRRSRPMALPK